MYARVENGNVKVGLPTVGTLNNGCTVSGYNSLDEDILLSEGWLPMEDIKPEYNAETHYLQFDGYTVLEDKIVCNYITVEIPPIPEPIKSEVDILKESNLALSEIVLDLLMWKIETEV